MNKYMLGDMVIETTKERYERQFKELGYVPYKEKSNKNKNNDQEEENKNNIED